LELLIGLKQKEIPDGSTPDEIESLKKGNKRRRVISVIGYILMAILVGLSIFAMFLIDAGYDSDDRVDWIVGYMQSLA